ncbi:MAG TPA: gamma carbonic anhydrase family protein [Rhizomicrobium sp.]|jgi:carbonic anhydrase/acetyltransferase-like protein (isoleucine patch superfamily)|nr:gamma carbonic anhydrase family protein [Rhizomicrobium sp.]
MPIYSLDGIEPEFPDGDSWWVAPSAVLIGRVRLRRNASIWFGAVLRGDNDWIEVGENSNIQDNSVCHTDPGQPVTIGANVTVGHKVILHSTTIGDNSLIGMGSTLLNRSRIGSNCLVGANSLIAEGKEFSDGSLVIGAPARAVRALGEQQSAMLRLSAEVYVRNFQRFRGGLKRLD